MYKSILDYFDETVLGNKEKNALLHKEESCTFAELQKRGKKLGTLLADKIGKQSFLPIVVLLPKSIDAVVADIGILYSANVFNNLDVKTPAHRLENILRLLKPAAVITSGQYIDIIDWKEHPMEVVNVDDLDFDNMSIDEKELSKRRGKLVDTDPFCIINTSGSTGTPKGVVLNYRSFFDFLTWSVETFHFSGDEVIGALSPIVFDIYDFEICLMMMKGSSMVLLDSALGVFPAKLLMELQEKKVNFLFWVPTIMVNIANMDLLEKLPLPDIKTVWFAGEVFPTKQFNYWKKHLPQAVFANLYGPIEITLDCIYYIVDKDFDDDEPLPIGIPCNNTDILLLSEEDNLCGVGEEGEICVRGTSLAMGYYNNPDKTAAAFVQNPLNTAYPELIYRTGDIASYGEDGLIHFKGRKDTLVKHQGYRIELGEIEHEILNNLKLVTNCCVVYDNKNKNIVLFYEESGKTEVEIRKALGNSFPRYMVPTVYHVMEELPRNTNGKIDRLKLSQMVVNE
ncbi:MAG: AMP-binding protein [Lachnospiraceae bacterium]|nr:AMP-binding protein [Lachnospiraceae bacterium]